MNTSSSLPFSRVHIVGTGLLGTSAGLALRARGVHVTLEDSSPSALSLAVDYGAGQAPGSGEDEPDLIIVATPPDVVGDVIVSQLMAHPRSLVMDVASVKRGVLDKVLAHADLAPRFVPSHPMAGRERGGAVSGRSDLFVARPWVICEGTEEAVAKVTQLVVGIGAIPVRMSAAEHDDAVALMSHTPQLISTLMAARLKNASGEALGLAGGGVRDVTRVAASDPALWVQILGANAPAVVRHLKDLRHDLDEAVRVLDDLSQPGAKKTLAQVMESGVAGVSRLPGKHGVSSAFGSLLVVIDDTPGQLASLLTQLGEWGINLEDLRLEHSPGAEVGFVELTIAKESVPGVEDQLRAGGWRIAGEAE